jgi:hypothetical protein
LPGKGFFDLARALARGPEEGESEREFHARELDLADKMIGKAQAASDGSHRRRA